MRAVGRLRLVTVAEWKKSLPGLTAAHVIRVIVISRFILVLQDLPTPHHTYFAHSLHTFVFSSQIRASRSTLCSLDVNTIPVPGVGEW